MPNDITVTKNTTVGSERWDVEYTADQAATVTKTLDTAGTMLDRDIKVSITTPAGSAATPATTVTANPSISVNSSTGVITATASASQSVTPTVSAGFVSSGTAGTITVSGSNTSNLTTQAAQTITPGTTDQTIAAGKYLTGAQTIKGDANLVAANIKKDVSIFGVTGTHEGGGLTLIGTDSVTANTTSTTATLIKTLTFPYSDFGIVQAVPTQIMCVVKDSAGSRAGYYYGNIVWTNYIYDASSSNYAVATQIQLSHPLTATSWAANSTATASSFAGVYCSCTFSKTNQIVTVKIYSKYNSGSYKTSTINGTYDVAIYRTPTPPFGPTA